MPAGTERISYVQARSVTLVAHTAPRLPRGQLWRERGAHLSPHFDASSRYPALAKPPAQAYLSGNATAITSGTRMDQLYIGRRRFPIEIVTRVNAPVHASERQ